MVDAAWCGSAARNSDLALPSQQDRRVLTEALQPHLDARRDLPAGVGALVAAGHRGIASGRGVYDWTKRDGAALLAKRRAELFRWLKVDRDEAQ